MVAAGLVVALGGCGAGEGRPVTLADWKVRWAGPVAAVSDGLDRVRAEQMRGDQGLILGACTQLDESLASTRGALPVPDAELDSLVRKAFDELAVGTADCLQAMRMRDSRLLESSIRELRQARASLDAVNLAVSRIA